MSEKELLEKFMKHLEDEQFDIIPSDCIAPAIRNFLEEHYKTYYEVEFKKKLKPLDMFDDRDILSMDEGDGQRTIHEMYDGRTVSFTKCWEDNEGYVHHTDNCSPYDCERNK